MLNCNICNKCIDEKIVNEHCDSKEHRFSLENISNTYTINGDNKSVLEIWLGNF